MIINQKHTDHHHQWCLYLFWILQSNIDLGRWGRWCFCICQRRPDLPFFKIARTSWHPQHVQHAPPSITRVSVRFRCLDFLNYPGKNKCYMRTSSGFLLNFRVLILLVSKSLWSLGARGSPCCGRGGWPDPKTPTGSWGEGDMGGRMSRFFVVTRWAVTSWSL